MFCPKCGNLLLPKGGVMKCSCGYTEKDGIIKDKKRKKDEIRIMDKSVEDGRLPKVKMECKECKHTEAYFWTLQTRSSDEPETKFYKCVNCGQVTRDYH